MSCGIAVARLKQERKAWRRDHPAGFWARPEANEDGSSNLLAWQVRDPRPHYRTCRSRYTM
jgi:ubiquitin-conjugating enzyme E2 I